MRLFFIGQMESRYGHLALDLVLEYARFLSVFMMLKC
jgi:hypothetical protein